jgi:hypothetical protein
MKLRAFVSFSLLALFACLLWPGQARATDHPFGHCVGPRAASCTLTVGPNQTIFIKESFGGSPALPTDSLTLTYTQARCDAWGTGNFCSYFAHTGASSGGDTVSFNVSTSGNEFVVESWDVSDVVNTGSLVDQSCFASGSMPTGTNNVSLCPIQSTETNDIFEYQMEGTDFFLTVLARQPTGQLSRNMLGRTLSAHSFFVNAALSASPITVIPSGAPSTTTLIIPMTNSTGSRTSFGAQLVTLKSGAAPAGRVRHRVLQKYRVPKRTELILFGAILPIWLRRKELTANGR